MSDIVTAIPDIVVLDGSSPADRALLGGKAWGVNAMRREGIPVPPAFALTTRICRQYFAAGGRLPENVEAALPDAVARLEAETGRTFGKGPQPLLVSVRSGAASSMPGMMDTILNLGLDDRAAEALTASLGERFVADVRRRFDEQFTHVVGQAPPVDPWDQLTLACRAVFESWQSARAAAYRKRYGLADDAGTAVTVQAMVFGNRDDRSGTGVLFTRNPLTGDAAMLGEWLPCAQGEDVVSGRHDALPFAVMEGALPDAYGDLTEIARRLERFAGDVQDIEFTVEAGKLWVLQTRSAKRSPQAAIRLAVQLVDEGLTSPAEVVAGLSPEQIALALKPGVDATAAARATVLAQGIPACPGVGSGLAVDDLDEAESRSENGEDVVLVRETTDPNDMHGIAAARAVVTGVGGTTSHAAVVCRELGMPAAVGCGEGTARLLAGRQITVDGTTGRIFDGLLPSSSGLTMNDADLAKLQEWARSIGGLHADRLLAVMR